MVNKQLNPIYLDGGGVRTGRSMPYVTPTAPPDLSLVLLVLLAEYE